MIELFSVEGLAAGRLAIALRPRGGDWLRDELSDLALAGWRTLVCALESSELAELDLLAAPALAQKVSLNYLRFPIPDRGTPSIATMNALAKDLWTQVSSGGSVAAHCRQGIGRSSLICAATLVVGGRSPAEAWRLLEAARGRSVPDVQEQRTWLDSFAHARL